MSLDHWLYLTEHCTVCNTPVAPDELICSECAQYLDEPSDAFLDQDQE